MEGANDIQWEGDSYQRLLERAAEKEVYGNYHGHASLGTRLLQEVQDKIQEISQNLNLYNVRADDERVAPLPGSGCVLVYKKEYYKDLVGTTLVRLLFYTSCHSRLCSHSDPIFF
ncbi:MAG: hypothetical protein ACPGJV_02075 [Bacteriovoracaceae bacterium]